MSTDLQYPIGRPQIPSDIEMSHIQAWIDEVAAAPALLRGAMEGLSDAQLDTPYRPEGWTVRQVVHHLPDSHMSTYLNFRMALSDDNPPMRPGNVNGWAALPDSLSADVQVSLTLFEGLQGRWSLLMRSMTREDFDRTLIAPNGAQRNLASMLAIYAWHGKHHVAHITSLRSRMGW